MMNIKMEIDKTTAKSIRYAAVDDKAIVKTVYIKQSDLPTVPPKELTIEVSF